MADKTRSFPFDEFEPAWQQHWLKNKTFRTPGPGEEGFDPAQPKYYILDMFPYPSGQGLHVGHPEGYTATDIVGRYKKMNGFNVLHPMGWDAFGLPAEQYAIKTGQHPRITTEANINNFRRQLQALGFGYDWDREVNTTDPGYVKWTQWIFIQLYNSYFCEQDQKAKPVSELEAKGWTQAQIDEVRLAFIHEAPVNWSPSMGTVLANEEVEEWKKKGETVERRPLRQWMLRITKYAQRLIDELEPLDWPESIKSLQRNWIGRSEGAEVIFNVHPEQECAPGEEHLRKELPPHEISVFTTRPDTLFGAYFMVLAPEHPLVAEITDATRKEEVEAYAKACASKSEMERGLDKEKTGVFTGAYVVNPVNDEKLPIWIADYVMMGYGSGAIMAVPAHDERDYAFAKTLKISRPGAERDPIRGVVAPADEKWKKQALKETGGAIGMADHGCKANRADLAAIAEFDLAWGWRADKDHFITAYPGHGTAINSGFLNGLPTPEAKEKMISWLEENGKGSRQINYKLRDWLFSRQRYWGEPFPLLWDKETGQHTHLPESELPLLQPEMEDFKPTGDPRGPLIKAEDWIDYSEQYTRETNTMPQWAGSCWYYLRYADPHNPNAFLSDAAEDYFGNDDTFVDFYVGGKEHAVLHLLYSRFWHKVLHDLGHLKSNEPFKRYFAPGLIMGEDGQKMSKSFGNVVNPDDVVEQYGADALRLYEMFMGPLEQTKPWSMKGVEGVYRFLAKVWRLREKITPDAQNADLAKTTHLTIKKVTECIETLRFNTAISAMMECVNAYTSAKEVPADLFRLFLTILNPFAPHLSEELNKQLNFEGELSAAEWPAVDESLLVESEITLIVQVNGKLRARIQVPAEASKEEAEAAALADENVQKQTEGKTVRKVIVVPKKLVNIVAN